MYLENDSVSFSLKHEMHEKARHADFSKNVGDLKLHA